MVHFVSDDEVHAVANRLESTWPTSIYLKLHYQNVVKKAKVANGGGYDDGEEA